MRTEFYYQCPVCGTASANYSELPLDPVCQDCGYPITMSVDHGEMIMHRVTINDDHGNPTSEVKDEIDFTYDIPGIEATFEDIDLNLGDLGDDGLPL